MSDRTGQHFGNYRILRFLDHGGFGDVYLGEHRYLKRAAALKILRVQVSEKNARRFLDEAVTHACLRHAHIVRVLDFDVQDGFPFLVLDYITGGSLRQPHPRTTPLLPLSTAINYIEQVASALQYAHNHSVIHRDVKPGNILLDGDQLLLGDFGLALFTEIPELLSTQDPVGTAPYTAPEQMQGKPEFASDQYSLGIVAYEWITGVFPFKGNALWIAEQHRSTPPPPLRQHRPDLPIEIERVVLKALAKDPHNRYPSVIAFANALTRSYQESALYEDDTLITLPQKAMLASTPNTTPTAINVSDMVFLSAPPGNSPLVQRLAEDLRQRGVRLANDLAMKQMDQEEELRERIRSVHRVIIAVTRRTRSSRQVKEHIRLAQVYQRRIVLVGLEGEGVAGLLLDHDWKPFQPVEVIDAGGARYQTALEELLVCLREETHLSASDLATVPATATVLPEPRNPYRGLLPFLPKNAADFFGREELITTTVAQLRAILTTSQSGVANPRLLALVGSSGSGKSSVMLAGLLPALQRGAIPGSETWVYLPPIMPGAHPLRELALALAARFTNLPVGKIQEDLQDDSTRGLHRYARALTKGTNKRVVLLIDQFEELFTHATSIEEQRFFIDVLLTAVNVERGSVVVLLTLRADFYDHLMRYPDLYRLIASHQQPVLPMGTKELRQVIERPADLPDVQLTFEGNLVGDLLFDAQGQAGALPLLEFTLDQLFLRRNQRTLTVSAYRVMGGVRGALIEHAESVYAALPSNEHRTLAHLLFMRLANLGMSEQDTTRRRARLSELALADEKARAQLKEVVDIFVKSRLLITDTVSGDTTVEVSHEALLREWPRLANWLRQTREDIRLQQAISNDVEAWEQRARPKDRLYQGSQLKEARAWAKRSKPNEQEAAFLRAGVRQQMRFVINIVAIVLLLTSSVGAIIWFFIIDPTLVITNSDNGPGSLRWVVSRAREGSTIMFAPNVQGQIILTSGDLDFDRNLTIQGPTTYQLAISVGNSVNIVHVKPNISVTIANLSFNHSHTSLKDDRTGVLYNEGTLKLIHVIVSDNSSYQGGGLYNESTGRLTLSNSIVKQNSAHYGGGLYNAGGGILTIINSTISNNSAINGNGGGIDNNGELIIMQSKVLDNVASGKGGGIAVLSSAGRAKATITSCTISDNRAGNGGGLYIQLQKSQNTVKISSDSKVTENHAQVGSPDISTGK